MGPHSGECGKIAVPWTDAAAPAGFNGAALR